MNPDPDDELVGLDPPDREVARALRDGAFAATCSVSEVDGRPDPVMRRDLEATALIRFHGTDDTEQRVMKRSVASALYLAATGWIIDSIEAPDLSAWTWTAAATIVTQRSLPPGLIVPRHLLLHELWVLAAQDDRGVSAAAYSEMPTPKGPLLGTAFADAIAKTTIPEARRRARKARLELRGDFRGSVARAVAEYFSTPTAQLGADDGPALLDFEISRYDPVARSWRAAASYPPSPPSPPSIHASKRRARLSDAARAAAEEDAFGVGIHSARAKRQVLSLDAPQHPSAPRSGPPTTLGDVLPDEGPDSSFEERLALEDLAARSGLSGREREVISLLSRGLKQTEIAERLAIGDGTVRVLTSRARRKIKESLKNSSDAV